MLTKTLLYSLMKFASVHSGHDIPDSLPVIKFRSESYIQRDLPGAIALYNYEKNILLMPNSCREMKTVFCRGVLTHELVHWLQDQHNRQSYVTCLSALEKEAYQVEDKYYRMNGSTLEEQGIAPWKVIAYSSCGSPGL